MASYQNAVVYAIRSHQTDKFYIGSTKSPMYKRMSNHRGRYKRWCKDNTCTYISSFEILKYDDAYIELLEECPCENVQQLRKKEGEHIRLHRDVCVNVKIAGRTLQETAKACNDANKEKRKANYETNKEEILAKQKAYYESHKEEIIAKNKVYREAHKEETIAYMAAYRAKAKALATDP